MWEGVTVHWRGEGRREVDKWITLTPPQQSSRDPVLSIRECLGRIHRRSAHEINYTKIPPAF